MQEAEAALRHAEIVGNVQFGRGGLGLGPGKPVWNKAGPKEKRKLVVEQVRRQEELLRGAKAVGQAQQGQWLNWQGVEKRKLSWRDLWNMEEGRIKFDRGDIRCVANPAEPKTLGTGRPIVPTLLRYSKFKAHFGRL